MNITKLFKEQLFGIFDSYRFEPLTELLIAEFNQCWRDAINESEIIVWLDENCKGGYDLDTNITCELENSNGLVCVVRLYINEKPDLVLFKLRWGGLLS
jgi:hypothetical protein